MNQIEDKSKREEIKRGNTDTKMNQEEEEEEEEKRDKKKRRRNKASCGVGGRAGGAGGLPGRWSRHLVIDAMGRRWKRGGKREGNDTTSMHLGQEREGEQGGRVGGGAVTE